jgi:DNA-directed RNA polymerase specialized sigma24 family protein
MPSLTLEERNLCVSQFLQSQLTSRERVLVAAYTLGYSPSQVAKALDVSAPAVTQMARRIETKAHCFWRQ